MTEKESNQNISVELNSQVQQYVNLSKRRERIRNFWTTLKSRVWNQVWIK